MNQSMLNKYFLLIMYGIPYMNFREVDGSSYVINSTSDLPYIEHTAVWYTSTTAEYVLYAAVQERRRVLAC